MGAGGQRLRVLRFAGFGGKGEGVGGGGGWLHLAAGEEKLLQLFAADCVASFDALHVTLYVHYRDVLQREVISFSGANFILFRLHEIYLS